METTAAAESQATTSALQDNLDRKGKNAYYFAHAHRADGPKWDGKPEPKLLKKESSDLIQTSNSTFDYTKSNITTYAFLDDGPKVKLYLELKDVGEKCGDQDVVLDYTATTLSFTLQQYCNDNSDQPRVLIFRKLTAPITDASFKIKAHRIILTLIKEDPDVEWHTINDKGTPDHEVV